MVLRARAEDAAHPDVVGLEADEVVLADQGARGDQAAGLAQAHPVDGVADAAGGPVQGSSSTGSPTATGPGSTVEP